MARGLQAEVSTADGKPDGALASLSAIATFGRSPEPQVFVILWPRAPEARFADRGPDDPAGQKYPGRCGVTRCTATGWFRCMHGAPAGLWLD